MGKLVLSLSGKILGDYPLNKERITIGRLPSNDIQIDNLAVSGQHAAVLTILNDSFIEDLNSTNGTYVNGRVIKKHALQHGDVIGLGKHELKYVNDQAGKTQESDFERTMIIRPAAAAASSLTEEAKTTSLESVAKALGETPESLVKEQVSGGKLPLARLQILNGPNAGKELELTKALTSVGKPGVQVAAITRRPQGYFIIHVEGGASSHPVINGQSIGVQARRLADHDVIEMAGVKMEFFLVT